VEAELVVVEQERQSFRLWRNGEDGGRCLGHCRISVRPAAASSMSRILWVWFSHCFEGVHREVALQHPLLLKAISVVNVAALISLENTPATLTPS
jgi:hypothetical protein